jgi:hypothetical protein
MQAQAGLLHAEAIGEFTLTKRALERVAGVKVWR